MWKFVCTFCRSKLHHNASLLQLPIGLGSDFSGIVDVIENKAFYYESQSGYDHVY